MFYSSCNARSLFWQTDGYVLDDALTVNRYNLNEVRKNVNEMYGVVGPETMSQIFLGWPNNDLEEWAVETNHTFSLQFELAYSHATMETTLFVRCLGASNMPWDEYVELYQEAQTMHKLRSNL